MSLDWAAVAVAAGTLPGIAMGSYLHQYIPQSILRRGFAVFLVVMAAFIFIEHGAALGRVTWSLRGLGADMSKELGFNVELPLAFDAAVTRVREALKQEGFGVLTEIDLRAAFREAWPGVSPVRDSRRVQSAARVRRDLGRPVSRTAAPVQRDGRMARGRRTGVRLTDPEALLSTVALQGAPELTSVARDARERMVRVAESLAKR